MHKALFILQYSEKVGLGHLTRCSVIAACLKRNRHSAILLTKNDSIENEKLKAFNQVYFYEDKDILKSAKKIISNEGISSILIDDYSIDDKDYEKLIKHNVKTFRFEAIPNFEDKSSKLINYNPDYDSNNGSFHLLGTKYVPIDECFIELNKKKVNNEIFVFFGGGGDHNAIEKYDEYLTLLSENHEKINIAITSSYKNRKQIINKYKENKKFSILVDSKKYPSILNNSLFAFVSGGTITYESAFLRTPMQIISVAENQKKQSLAWGKNKNGVYVGSSNNISSSDLISSYKKYFATKKLISAWHMQRKIRIDGLGAQRIVNALIN